MLSFIIQLNNGFKVAKNSATDPFWLETQKWKSFINTSCVRKYQPKEKKKPGKSIRNYSILANFGVTRVSDELRNCDTLVDFFVDFFVWFMIPAVLVYEFRSFQTLNSKLYVMQVRDNYENSFYFLIFLSIQAI